MTRWIVFEPPAEQAVGAPLAASAPSDRAVFVRDAFAKWAVVFPFLWLFRHGLILAGLVVLVAEVGLGLLAGRPGLAPAAVVLPLLLGVLVALEGPSLRAARYRRKGYVEAATVVADDEEEAAILYFSGAVAASAPDAPPAVVATPATARSTYFQNRLLRAEGRSLLDPVRRA